MPFTVCAKCLAHFLFNSSEKTCKGTILESKPLPHRKEEREAIAAEVGAEQEEGANVPKLLDSFVDLSVPKSRKQHCTFCVCISVTSDLSFMFSIAGSKVLPGIYGTDKRKQS